MLPCWHVGQVRLQENVYFWGSSGDREIGPCDALYQRVVDDWCWCMVDGRKRTGRVFRKWRFANVVHLMDIGIFKLAYVLLPACHHEIKRLNTTAMRPRLYL